MRLGRSCAAHWDMWLLGPGKKYSEEVWFHCAWDFILGGYLKMSTKDKATRKINILN